MQPSELTTPDTADDRERQAKLVAAAELMRQWVQSQRTGAQSGTGAAQTVAPAVVTLAVSEESSEAPASQAPIQVSELLENGETAEAPPEFADPTEEPASEAVEEPRRFQMPSLSVPPEMLRWIMRSAVAALVAAGVVALSWTLRSAWPAWKPAASVGTAIIEADAPGTTVLIDGEAAGTAPLTKELSVGPHRIEFRRKNVTRVIPIDVVKGRATTTRVEWMVRRFGKLKVSSTPTGAEMRLDGKVVGSTPVSLNEVTAGAHTLSLKSGNSTLQRSITIAENDTTELNESIFSGWLHVSSPIELRIADGKKAVRLDERNQALLQPGEHELRFENRTLGFSVVRRVDVKPGETTSVTIELPQSSVSVTTSYPAEVFIDGVRAGDTPLENFVVNIGTRELTINSTLGGTRKVAATVTVQPFRLAIDYSQPQQMSSPEPAQQPPPPQSSQPQEPSPQPPPQ